MIDDLERGRILVTRHALRFEVVRCVIGDADKVFIEIQVVVAVGYLDAVLACNRFGPGSGVHDLDWVINALDKVAQADRGSLTDARLEGCAVQGQAQCGRVCLEPGFDSLCEVWPSPFVSIVR